MVYTMSGSVGSVGSAPRNTNIGGAGKYRAWLLTWNNHSEADWEYVETYGKTKCAKYRAQEEIGEQGTKHIQFCLYYKNQVRFETVKKAFPECHIEWSNNWERILNYCSKQETRNGKEMGLTDKPRFLFEVKDPLEGRTPYTWQEEILAILDSEPDDRTIYWYWEPVGCRGKTSLAKHICLKDPNALYLSGKAADMKYGVFCAVEQGIDVRTIIMDFTRSQEDFVSWQGLEEIKNGMFYNTKYESKMCLFNSPHIICFANWEPPAGKLSNDRLIVRMIPDESGSMEQLAQPVTEEVDEDEAFIQELIACLD